jgi:hypothetical protein
MGWAIYFVMFGMSNVTLLDPTLRSHEFDEPEKKKYSGCGRIAFLEKGCVNRNKVFKMKISIKSESAILREWRVHCISISAEMMIVWIEILWVAFTFSIVGAAIA